MKQRYADFVKLTDVHNIVEGLTVPLFTAMRAREDEAISMKNQVAILNSEMKK